MRHIMLAPPLSSSLQHLQAATLGLQGASQSCSPCPLFVRIYMYFMLSVAGCMSNILFHFLPLLALLESIAFFWAKHFLCSYLNCDLGAHFRWIFTSHITSHTSPLLAAPRPPANAFSCNLIAPRRGSDIARDNKKMTASRLLKHIYYIACQAPSIHRMCCLSTTKLKVNIF
jgi:hypothetical protein